MNKLVLIGNGFDLAHGLKTKYSDFLLWYLNGAFKSLTNRMSHDDYLIELSAIRPNSYPVLKSLEEFKDYIRYNQITIRSKNEFVKNIIDHTIQYKWVDIEALYYTSLIRLYQFTLTNGKSSIKSELPSLNISFNYIKTQLKEYLKTIKCMENIENEISNHFTHEFMRTKKANESNEVLFLNFNYTNTIENYRNSLPNSWTSEVNYIHGKLNDELNPIIFGYGDEMDIYYEKIEQLNDNEFIKNIKSFDYLKTNNYQEFSRFIDSNPFDVLIMGHSCGLSDRILLNSIFEHEKCGKIKIFYYQKSKDENDFFEKTQEISRHFRPINKNRMRKILVPFTECKPLIEFKS